MRNEEILHRFFDEGLDESLEDSLFSRIAVDSELRRQFVEHMKLHSMIQEDVASITTPAHVTQKLFADLGLTLPETAPIQTTSAWTRRAAAVAAAFGTWLLQYRGYIATAVTAAGITAIVFMYTGDSGRVTLPAAESRVGQQSAPDKVDARNPGTSDVFEPGSSGNRSSHATMLPPGGAAVPPELRTEPLATESGTRFHDVGSVSAAASVQRPAAVAAMQSDAIATRSITDAELPKGIALTSSWRTADDETSAGIAPTPIAVSQTGIIEPWHFFRPQPGESILSNLVFELRKQYGESYPEVNLPHNSHKVFENMALNVVYKSTDHHAFGFEYGREDFGQKYDRMVPVQQFRSQDPNLVQIGVPDETSTMAEFQERRMLDVFGAVWKLSLPEYGILGMVYPYMRTFVGATKQGPLGKVRVGLEMYPSNFSMFNVGIEGGMLRYSVEQTSYYSAKLNYSFGVALGF